MHSDRIRKLIVHSDRIRKSILILLLAHCTAKLDIITEVFCVTNYLPFACLLSLLPKEFNSSYKTECMLACGICGQVVCLCTSVSVSV